MAGKRVVKKITVPVSTLRAMSDDDRYAILFLGHLLNEANWLRKLLVKAVVGISDDTDGQPNFALTALLVTTLAGKIHEGWDRIATGRLGAILGGIGLPAELDSLRSEIDTALKRKTFLRIRNNLAFHYPNRTLDFNKLSAYLEDSDTAIYVASEGYQGDVFSQISSLAGIEPLVALDPNHDYRVALAKLWEEITDIVGKYCIFVAEAMATMLMKAVSNPPIEDVVIGDVPECQEYPLRFYVQSPSDLEEMRTRVKARRGEILRARPVEGEIDHAALSREFMARYPKIRAALAE